MNDESLIDLDPTKLETTISHERMKQTVFNTHTHKPDGSPFTCGDICCNISAGNHYCVSSSPTSDFEPFGIGIVLYFKFLKRLMWFFLIFIIFSAAPLLLFCFRYFSIPGAQLSYYDVLTSTTLGSLGITSTTYHITKPPSYASGSQSDVFLNCPEGTLTSYSNVFYGLVGAGQSGNLIMKSDVDTDCNDPTGVDAAYSASCEGMSSCTFTIPNGMFLSTTACGVKYDSMNVYISSKCDNGDMTIYNVTVPKSLFSFIVAGCDGAIIIIYLLMVYTMKSSTKSAINNVLKNAYSGSQFTTLVKNFPNDLPPDSLKRELWGFFEKTLNYPINRNFRVVDIQFIFPHRLLELRAQRGELMTKKIQLGREFVGLYANQYQGINITVEQIAGQLQNLKDEGRVGPKVIKKAEKLFNKINEAIEKKAEVDREIQLIESSADTNITGAFVTFNTIAALQKCIDTFNTSPLERCCICLAGQKDLYFRGKLLQAFTADDPDNILWQNLGTPSFEISVRRGLSFLLTIILFVVTIGALVAPTYYQNQFLQKYPQTNCKGLTVTQAQAASDYAAGELGQGLLACYCKEDLYGRLWDRFSTASNQQLCLKWFESEALSISVSFGVIIAVIVANKVVDVIFKALSTFEKHNSSTERIASRTIKSFIAQFINTGLIYLLVNAKLSSVSFWQGKYTDTVPVWYRNVGAVLLSTMIVNLIALPLVEAISCLFASIFRCWDRGCSQDEKLTKKKFQKDYVALYSGPKFEIDKRYSFVINIIFVCFLYSSSIPLLYTTALIQLMVVFFVDKYLLLKHSKRPEPYDEKLDLTIQSLLYYIIVVHLVFAIWMYGNADYFDSSYLSLGGTLSQVQNLVDSVNQASYGPITTWSTRAVQSYNYIILVILILVLVLFFVKGFLVNFCKRTFCTLCIKGNEKSARVAPAMNDGENNMEDDFRDPQQSTSFFDVITSKNIATLVKLAKYTLENDSVTDEAKDLNARKILLLKKMYDYKVRMEAQGQVDPNINFIGLFTYDLRLSPIFKDQFGIEKLLDKYPV